MKETIVYSETPYCMGDLLLLHGISVKKDLLPTEKNNLLQNLKKYLQNSKSDKIKFDLGKIYLQIDNIDEAGHLMSLLN